LAVDFILSYFDKKVTVAQKSYRDFVTSLIGREYESPLSKLVASTILGHPEFVKKIKKKYLPKNKKDRNLPALRHLSAGPLIEDIEKQAELIFRDAPRLSRKAALYLSHRYSGRKLKDIGSYFDLSESAVSQASSRFALQIQKDRQLERRIEQVYTNLSL